MLRYNGSGFTDGDEKYTRKEAKRTFGSRQVRKAQRLANRDFNLPRRAKHPKDIVGPYPQGMVNGDCVHDRFFIDELAEFNAMPVRVVTSGGPIYGGTGRVDTRRYK